MIFRSYQWAFYLCLILHRKPFLTPITANNSPSSPTHHNMKAIVSRAPCSAIASYVSCVSCVDDPNQVNDTTLSKGRLDSWKAPIPPLAHQDSVKKTSTTSQHIHKAYLNRRYPKVHPRLLSTYQGDSSWIGPQNSKSNSAMYFRQSISQAMTSGRAIERSDSPYQIAPTLQEICFQFVSDISQKHQLTELWPIGMLLLFASQQHD